MTTETTTEATYVPTVEEEAQQFVKENSADNIVARLIQLQERVVEVEANKDRIWTTLQETRQKNVALRDTVRGKFVDMLDGDKDATVELDLEAINELLDDIGASKIIFTYSVDVKVTATITGIEANSEEEAREKVLRAIELRVETDRLGDDADVDDEDYEIDNVQEEDN